MYNEGELLEKFGIRIYPITMSEFTDRVLKLEKGNNPEVLKTIAYLENNLDILVPQQDVIRVAALKTAMKTFALENGCSGIAIQCWNALQDVLHIMPCMSNSLLTDEGIPVACETDIHGAITAVLAQAAAMGETPPFFADWTVRHPSNKNGELLQHCGPWPVSLTKEGTKAELGTVWGFGEDYSGVVNAEIKGGEISILRFDGDHGEYTLLMGKARGINGPYNRGSYLWVEVKNLNKLEHMLVTGPYIHHCVGIHKNILPPVYEACKYIPELKTDFYDVDEEENIKAWLLGDV